jgi:hypothetical protein
MDITSDSGATMTGSTQGIKTVLHPVSDLATAPDPDGNVLGLLQDR